MAKDSLPIPELSSTTSRRGRRLKPLHQYEPWKVVSVAFATGVFLALGGFALGLLILAHFIQ